MKHIESDIRQLSRHFDGRGTVSWLQHASEEPTTEAAEPALLDRELYLARPFRQGNRYIRQRNYHGWYYFAQTGRHVWVESLLEATRLASLDMSADIVAVASQPMRIDFADGTRHLPDFLALHANGRQVLYDVKPSARVTEKYLRQFARTLALCERVGWGYDVLTELPKVETYNLDWLRLFKHDAFHPEPERVRALIDALTEPMPLKQAAHVLNVGTLADSRSAVFHLLWRRLIITDLSVRLSDESLVERNPDAHA